jgi:hypothetical protein
MAGHGRKGFRWKRFFVYGPFILILEHVVYSFYYTEAVLSTGTQHKQLF